MENNYPEVLTALKILSNVCDGAISHDGCGFNGRDSSFGKSLASRSRLTYNQANKAYEMLRKYKGQLHKLGMEYENIPVPKPAENKEENTYNGEGTKKASLKKEGIEVRFSFPKSDSMGFQSTLADVKSLPGRKFNPTTKVWVVPFSDYVVEKLAEWRFSMDDKLLEKYEESLSKKQRETKKDRPLSLPAGLALRPFQEEGVQFLLKNEGGLIADEMGLGKTVQALAYLSVKREETPVIIVCPASLKLNWEREARKWLPTRNIRVVSGTKSADYGKKDDIIIINYDIVKGHVEALSEIKPQIIILDESHYIKNHRTQRTKYTRQLAKDIPIKIALSGTPITNRPIEFFSTLNLLDPLVWSSFWQYAQRYCGAVHNGFGWDFTGASHTEELHKILTDSVMIRRLKKDVLKELPPKQPTVIPLEIDNRVQYNKAERDIIEWLAEMEGEAAAAKASNAQTLVEFEKLKQLAVWGKIKSVLSWINDTLEEKDKLVIFATHHETIDLLMKEYPNMSVKLDGRDNMAARQKAVDSFQTDPSIRLFVGNIKAAGVGITLTAADTCVFLELDWTPGNHLQAEDRIHRIGQEAEAVNIYYLMAANTIEDELASILDHKRIVLTKVLDGETVEDGSLLSNMIETYKNRRV